VRLKRWALLKTGLLAGAILTPWNKDLESSTRKQAAPLTGNKRITNCEAASTTKRAKPIAKKARIVSGLRCMDVDEVKH
jgi:hypothetical protein